MDEKQKKYLSKTVITLSRLWLKIMLEHLPDEKVKPQSKIEKRIYQIYAMGGVDALTQNWQMESNFAENLIREIRKNHLKVDFKGQTIDLRDTENEFESPLFVHGSLNENEMKLLFYSGINNSISLICMEDKLNDINIQSNVYKLFAWHIDILRQKGIEDFWQSINSMGAKNEEKFNILRKKYNSQKKSHTSGCLLPIAILLSSFISLIIFLILI